MKRIPLLTLFIAIGIITQAQQQPQHMVTPPATAAKFTGSFTPFVIGGRTQVLYYPNEFPGIPKGFITNLYFKHYDVWDSPAGFTYTDFYMGMSYYNGASETGDTLSLNKVLPLSWYSTDTVLYYPSYTINTPVLNGDWVKFVLQKPFLYDPAKRFILDVSIPDRQPHSGTVFYGISAYSFQDTAAYKRGYAAILPTPPNNIGWSIATPIFGFDIIPLDVTEVTNLAALNIYPNPTEGKFTVSFSAPKKINEVSVSVTTVTGGKVIQESFKEVNSSFPHTVDLSEMAKGVYFIEVKADGERVVRKVVVE